MIHLAKIMSISHVTHDVLGITLEKPEGLNYIPGQAVDVSINKEGWENELRPFTFTSLPEEDHLEFTIKTYPSHQGVTHEMLTLKPNDSLILGDVFGDIHYKGEGIFIAGGAGITPFIAILKDLEKKNKIGNNKLIFGNKTKADIILEEKFNALLGKNFVNVLSEEQVEGYEHGHISEALIKKHLDPNLNYYYICGPDPMMDAIEKQLASLGVSSDSIVREGF